MNAQAASCDASTPHYQAYREVAHDLRCPVCEGQRIDSSDAPFALTVRRDICKYLHEGMKPGEVRARIAQDYGADLEVAPLDSSDMVPLLGILVLVLVIGCWRVARMARRQ